MKDVLHNTFKQALKNGDVVLGMWLGLASPYSAELLANTGYDWLLIDGEHAPNDVHSILAQLQAIAPYDCQPVVRLIEGQTALIKQVLDLGAQTVLIPMVESATQAAQLVAATRYPPEGIRGVGSALARGSRWNQIPNYLQRANHEICVLLQVESVAGLAQLDGIAATEGVDGVFFGPSDLAASMGYTGQPNHPDVVAAIIQGIQKTREHQKATGVLATDLKLAQMYLEAGAQFVAIGVDTSMLMQSAKNTLDTIRPTASTVTSNSSGY
ncbi:4-hydroxy-2-oxo-heptane-1,7-dioate aldolase [Ephemeroptericola cinctiostellae]|uniref:4-hydroxy-2-oxo-heptane-1,7-dioate aldolase n=1 Tax=Ephemeroptericola cinctiostellae TaxID=2268024 RepID=A0A345DC98_9BURK|nr:4-hydroxy-2-oxoheptanedioate aldolase [Ephemeroptericola cinctiostellae]AXF85986.1 4-hydroxy-2-oxo-heptane-1,7-dioate aldolase [Ephemeroptericola cinctiostellae]